MAKKKSENNPLSFKKSFFLNIAKLKLTPCEFRCLMVLNYGNYKERTLFYWAKMYTGELQKNDDYLNLKNAIAINVIDFNLFDCREYHSTFKIFEEHRQELLTDKFRIDFLELRKAKECKERGAMTDKKQMWMDFLNTNAEDDETLERLASGSPVMKKAIAVLRQMSADEKELYEIEQREKAVRDEVSARAYERQQGEKQGAERERNSLINKMRK